MTPAQKLIAHIRKNGKTESWGALTKRFAPDKYHDWSRQTLRVNGFDIKTGEFSLESKIERTKEKRQLSAADQHAKELTGKVIDLEKDLRLALAIKKHKPSTLKIAAPKNIKANHAATAIWQWSDWHVDEVVDIKTVNGLNAYNPQVAKARAAKLFENSVKLTNTQRNAVNIDNVVIHLGGDFIGGYIHPELEQTNSMSPLEGITFALDLIASGLEYVKKYAGFKRIICVCSRGNHPRLTRKMQFANDYSMNLETFLYQSLASRFPEIEFIIEQGDLIYLDIYDKPIRFFHGHQIRFMGGIGGMTIPLYKAIHRWNDTRKAFYNFMCDKHTYSNPVPDAQVNGSLKGFDAFASSLGFKFQPALQSFTLLDARYGITIKAPIHCDEYGK